jgi:hypothetical protein
MTQYTTRFFRQRHRPRGVAPGYVVHGRWPIEPVVMFDGPNAIPGFFANGDIYYSLGQRPRNRASHVIPYSFSQGRCPWLWCAWPLANPTGRDVRWPKCDTRFFSPKAILIIAWGNAPGRANHVIPYSSSQGRCPWLWCAWPLANRTVRDVRWRKCDTRFFSPKAIFRRNQSQTYCSSNLIP